MSGLPPKDITMKKLILILAIFVMSAFAADTTGTVDAHRQKIDAAVAARDYDAWKAEHDAYAKGNGGAKVTRENFETFAKMHEAQSAGRTDEAAALRTELGMGQGKGAGKGQGQGQGKGAGKGQGQGQGMQGCQKSAGTQCAKGQGGGAGKGNGGGKGQGCQRKQ
jgi:hypothetical protein